MMKPSSVFHKQQRKTIKIQQCTCTCTCTLYMYVHVHVRTCTS